MNGTGAMELSYFPGCSMATSARESNASLISVCDRLGLKLIELEDWNCCGSTAATSLAPEVALDLACRNLSLAPANRPLMVMCPSCHIRLLAAHQRLKEEPDLRERQERRWGRGVDPELKIIHFLDFLSSPGMLNARNGGPRPLNGLRFAPYYGCMLARPPALRKERSYYGSLEKILGRLDASPLRWRSAAQCCGTFLAAARPDIAGPLVNRIMEDAAGVGAECIVTACAMCQLNLEIRCTADVKIPILHLSEVMALAHGETGCEAWFRRHLIDPRPALKKRGLMGR